MTRSIALVGDYSSAVIAHQAIPLALTLACEDISGKVTWDWVHTREIRDASRDLAHHAGVWAAPASPYENTTGVLDAIRWARETRRPFLGTCGGFQHALIEFARNVLGLRSADHAETNPSGSDLVVTALACSLVEKSGPLQFTAGSRLCEIYGHDSAREGYHCSYRPSSAYRREFEQAGLQFTAYDEANEPRAAELPVTIHPFFIGTLFQSKRVALRGETPPLVRAFVKAVLAFRS